MDENRGRQLSDDFLLGIEQINPEDVSDENTLIEKAFTSNEEHYLEHFLLSYRYYISPLQLFKTLEARFLKTREGGQQDAASTKRILDVLASWVEVHFFDFEKEPELLNSLEAFIKVQLVTSGNYIESETGKALSLILDKKKHHLDVPELPLMSPPMRNDNPGDPQSRPSRTFNVLDFAPTEIAHQLTLIAYERFKQIKPHELYSGSWLKENAFKNSPNVISGITHFNNVSTWIALSIVSTTIFKKRILILKHFISVAWITCGYRDFETTFAIFLGLQQNTVSRLSETWKALDDTAKVQWEKLSETCDFRQNYKIYRRSLKNLFAEKSLGGKNVVPYIGLYLKDLSTLEENSTITKGGKVNLYKLKRIVNIISEILVAQTSIFNFKKNVKIFSFFKNQIFKFDEDTMWRYSKVCENISSEDASELRSNLTTEKKSEIEVVSFNPIHGLSPNKTAKSMRGRLTKSTSSSGIMKKITTKIELEEKLTKLEPPAGTEVPRT